MTRLAKDIAALLAVVAFLALILTWAEFAATYQTVAV